MEFSLSKEENNYGDDFDGSAILGVYLKCLNFTLNI